MQIQEMLSGILIFKDIAPKKIEQVVECACFESYPGDCTVFAEGDLLSHLYVVEEGAVQMSVDVRLWPDEDTVRTAIRTIQAGGVFGWAAVLDPPKAVTSARTVSKAKLIAIDGADLRRLLIQESPLAYNMMAELFRVVEERDRVTSHAEAMELAVRAAEQRFLRQC